MRGHDGLGILTGSAHGTKEDRIVLLQLLEAAVGDVLPRLLVRLRAPIVVREVEVKRLQLVREGLEDLNAGLNDLGPYPVCGDGRDAVGLLCRIGAGRHLGWCCRDWG